MKCLINSYGKAMGTSLVSTVGKYVYLGVNKSRGGQAEKSEERGTDAFSGDMQAFSQGQIALA